MNARAKGGTISGGSPTIFVSDVQAAVDFYTGVLGFRIQYRADDHFAMIDAGNGFTLGLHPPSSKSPRPGTQGAIEIGFTVHDPLEDVVRSLQSRGVVFRVNDDGGAIVDDGSVRLAFFGDIDGNPLYLCETT